MLVILGHVDFLILRHQDTLTNQKITMGFQKSLHIFVNINNLKIQIVDIFGKDRCRTKTDNPLHRILEIFEMRSISIKKHEMDIW